MNNLKMKSKFRFHIDYTTLMLGKTFSLSNTLFHHVHTVLRLTLHDIINVFNEHDGEFVAEIININKKTAEIKILSLLRNHQPVSKNLHLAYAPLKKNSTDYAISKAVEVGVTQITQVITDNTVNHPLSLAKIKQKLISSTQQCNRLDVPIVNETLKISDFLNRHKDNTIFWLNEKKEGFTLSEYLRNNLENEFKNSIFLIGPEGGFSDNEIKLLKSFDFVIPVYMNTNILRAETAAIAVLINFQIIVYNF